MLFDRLWLEYRSICHKKFLLNVHLHIDLEYFVENVFSSLVETGKKKFSVVFVRHCFFENVKT